ncbi:hypothetical protein QO010_002958 [Caulobacter ginsengisoli]|uniref:VCBS repeat-containing protein n=1 Tax=Caulobacter ginsengisoli TaxID=400775 RepID=A0ABU0IT48_9CAUL|nr:FG-GAP-like repeat-containing protein [Caulobacter ginsengisoli]MDQ0465174.1 hypothetical protein [Caulobacter ginsengisoli]
MPVQFTEGSLGGAPAPSTGLRQLVGDFDNDGDIDFFGQLVGSDAYVFYRNNGSGVFTAIAQASSPFAGITFPGNVSDTWRVGDFDGDGDDDVWVIQANSTGLFYRQAAGVFTSVSSAAFPSDHTGSSRFLTADFNGDGAVDILYQTGGTGSAFSYSASNGSGGFTNVAQASSPFAGLTLPD